MSVALIPLPFAAVAVWRGMAVRRRLIDQSCDTGVGTDRR
jgi:hypothetical protein